LKDFLNKLKYKVAVTIMHLLTRMVNFTCGGDPM